MLSIFRQKEKGETLESKHLDILERSRNLGKQLAQRGLPKLTGDTLSQHVSILSASYRNLLDNHCTKSSNTESIIELEKNALSANKERLENKLKGLRDRLSKL